MHLAVKYKIHLIFIRLHNDKNCSIINPAIFRRKLWPYSKKKVIVVTGASESIGRALCLALATQKPKLVLVARNQNRLNPLKEEIESKGKRGLNCGGMDKF
jgi:shikimate 5-dehydrogenase